MPGGKYCTLVGLVRNRVHSNNNRNPKCWRHNGLLKHVSSFRLTITPVNIFKMAFLFWLNLLSRGLKINRIQNRQAFFSTWMPFLSFLSLFLAFLFSLLFKSVEYEVLRHSIKRPRFSSFSHHHYHQRTQPPRFTQPRPPLPCERQIQKSLTWSQHFTQCSYDTYTLSHFPKRLFFPEMKMNFAKESLNSTNSPCFFEPGSII